MMRRTNAESLRSCLGFRVFRLDFASDFFNLLLASFHQADIIIVKHLIQGRNNETRLGVELLTLRSGSSQNRRSKPLHHAKDKDGDYWHTIKRRFLEDQPRVRSQTNVTINIIIFLLLLAYLSSYHEKAINALYELA